MSTNKSFFTKLFGDELGQLIQVVLGIFIVMTLFFLFPQIFIRISSSSPKHEKYNEILTDSKKTTQNIFKNIQTYDSLTRDIDIKIDNELLLEKQIINNKRDVLIECQKDFDSIYLTPQQLRILATVKSESKDISFTEWISSSNQWYNILVSFLISLFFYFIGRNNGKKMNKNPSTTIE